MSWFGCWERLSWRLLECFTMYRTCLKQIKENRWPINAFWAHYFILPFSRSFFFSRKTKIGRKLKVDDGARLEKKKKKQATVNTSRLSCCTCQLSQPVFNTECRLDYKIVGPHFLVACYATLQSALSVRWSVRRSVRPSVRPSYFTFLGFLRSLASLLLPKWSSDLKYGLRPPARDWASCVSGLCSRSSHLNFMSLRLLSWVDHSWTFSILSNFSIL